MKSITRPHRGNGNANLRRILEEHENHIENAKIIMSLRFCNLINDQAQPWLADYADLCEYLSIRWNMTERRAQQIAAATTVQAMLCEQAPDLAPVVQAMLEGQVRELVHTPAEKRVVVLREAVAGGKVTARTIRQAKVKVIDAETGKEESPAPRCPCCGQDIKPDQVLKPWSPVDAPGVHGQSITIAAAEMTHEARLAVARGVLVEAEQPAAAAPVEEPAPENPIYLTVCGLNRAGKLATGKCGMEITDRNRWLKRSDAGAKYPLCEDCSGGI